VLHLGRLRAYPQTLDWAGKASNAQTLWLITKISKFCRKKFYNIDTSGQCDKTIVVIFQVNYNSKNSTISRVQIPG
jgi:hypothetical protein